MGSFTTGLQPARIPVVVFGKILVTAEALGGSLGPHTIANRPPKGFHEGDAGSDDAEVDFESIRVVSRDQPVSNNISHILVKAFPIPIPSTSFISKRFQIQAGSATYRTYPFQKSAMSTQSGQS